MDENDRLRAGTLPDDPEDGTEEMAPPADAVEELRAEYAQRRAELEEWKRGAEAKGINLDGKADPFADTWRTVNEWGEVSGADLGGIDLDPGRWLEVVQPERRYLLKVEEDGRRAGMLPLGKVGMLAAGGGAGKTMALCQLAVAVAGSMGPRGFPHTNSNPRWFGHFLVDTPGYVLLALGEEDAPEVRRRLYNAAHALDMTEEQRHQAAKRIIPLPLAGTNVALQDPEDPDQDTWFASELRRRLEEEPQRGRWPEGDGWALVILDPCSRFAGIDAETDNASATRFVEILETFTRAPGNPTVIFAHHTTKAARGGTSDATAARGASALTDGVRWQANIDTIPNPADLRRTLPDLAEFHITKNNYGRYPAPLPLRRLKDHGGALVGDPEIREELERKREEAKKAEAMEKAKDKARIRGAADAIKAASRDAGSTKQEKKVQGTF